VKRLGISGTCLGVVMALAAVLAGPALAKKPASYAKEFKPFADCPFNAAPVAEGFYGTDACVVAKSESSSEFQAGNVTVDLTKPITLQGGFEENEEEELVFVGTEYGNTTLSLEKQPGPSLTELVEPSLLSASELSTYERDVAAGETKVTATVELAGPPTAIDLNEANLLHGHGVALGLPVEVKLSNAFLGKTCYVGSNSDPIVIDLTTGKSGALTGKVGRPESNVPGTILNIYEDSLVNNTYVAPAVTGCGYGGSVDAALDAKIGLPSPAGENEAIINGTLKQAGVEVTKEELEKLGMS
jgi:hypothetical protein